ncbi:hypothetical protein PG985_013240 [Apiospora marii]|uniref:Rhodopsin domain-containing protein n=1 Tax=Apiospora marii TaxID=335849 RepID=A0ABR1R8E7_9PEZI
MAPAPETARLPSDDAPPPPVAPGTLQGDRRPMIYHASAWMAVAATITLAMRLFSRRVTRQKLATDDWLVVAAQIFEYSAGAITIRTAVDGIGIHKEAAMAKPSFKSDYAEMHKYSAYVLAALVGIWWSASVGVGLFGCRPISKGWALEESRCIIFTNGFATASTIPVIVINLAIITLPVYEVLRLQVRVWKKVALVGLFLLGGLSVVAGIVRWVMIASYYNDDHDMFYEHAVPSILMQLELCAAIAGVCLSTSGPIVKWFAARVGWKRKSTVRQGLVRTIMTIAGSSGRPRRRRSTSLVDDEGLGSFVRLNQSDDTHYSTELLDVPPATK